MEIPNSQQPKIISDSIEANAWLECDQYYSPTECPINKVLDLISHKWTVQIIYYLHRQEVVRFRQLHRLITPITQKELTKKLKKLEDSGLVHRHIYAEVPPRVEYRLTELGLSLVEPIIALYNWAERNYDLVESYQSRS